MNREQQRNLKLLKKALPEIIRQEIKKYNIKKRDFMIWKQKDELFFDALIHISEKDGNCYCSIRETMKPLWVDDILWDVLAMSENKKESMSLRCIGAFTVFGVELYNVCDLVKNWKQDELQRIVSKYIEHFYESIRTVSIHTYHDLRSKHPYHREIRNLVSMIHEEQYEEAIQYARKNTLDEMSNQGLTVKAGAIKYCQEVMRKVG